MHVRQDTCGYFHISSFIQAGHWGFIEYRPPKKKPEYRPNIDHTALYRPNIDHKSSLKSAYLHVLRHNPTSQEIHVNKVLVDIFIFLHLMAE